MLPRLSRHVRLYRPKPEHISSHVFRGAAPHQERHGQGANGRPGAAERRAVWLSHCVEMNCNRIYHTFAMDSSPAEKIITTSKEAEGSSLVSCDWRVHVFTSTSEHVMAVNSSPTGVQ